MKRSEGEKLRIAHAIGTLRSSLYALELALRCNAPPGPDVYQPIVQTSVDLACSIAKLAAFMWAEEDAER